MTFVPGWGNTGPWPQRCQDFPRALLPFQDLDLKNVSLSRCCDKPPNDFDRNVQGAWASVCAGRST
jgi:hypothetical protein